jgi:ubiquinone/menaquinone biosynthesis C-methylase UbiE
VADRETRRLSFGSVAADYDRYRPSPPPEALDWLIPPGAQAILDLAAGTGAVTRKLIGRAARIIAVEPDERMRAVLTAGCPEAEVLAGRGEDIPLPDASVDAVVISAAWHWLDPGQAVPEITRVLRTGGVLGVMGISRDMRVPWVAELSRLARQARLTDRSDGSADRRGRREVVFPAGTPMSALQEHAVEYSLPMTKDELVGLLGTYSGVITLDPGRRADFSLMVRAFLDRQPWDRIDLPLICRCLRSRRLPG